MQRVARNIVFVIILLLVLLPPAQRIFNLIGCPPLKGAVELTPKPAFSLPAWFSGNWQQEAEKYLNQHSGFYPHLIRVGNQVSYSLFDEARARGVVVGREGYLFEVNYVKAYQGVDFPGGDTLADQLKKLKLIQDSLQARNIDIFTILMPGKASFYPEYIPGYLRAAPSQTTKKAFARISEELGLRVLDLHAYFNSIKGSSKYPLFPKLGIHWTYYGELLAADTIVRYIEKLRGTDLPDIIIDSIIISDTAAQRDKDIAEGMNLMFDIPSERLAYPQYTINEQGKDKPRVFVIADSFFWNMYHTYLGHQLFTFTGFWYYFRELYSKYDQLSPQGRRPRAHEAISNNDIIILSCSDASLGKLFWGFIDETSDYYKLDFTTRTRKDKIEDYAKGIRNSPEWLETVSRKAQQQGLPLDTMIMRDAVYLYELENAR
jgi:hypothetical protein